MSKSEFTESLDAVQKQVSAFLKPLGFQEKGRSFNRTKESGLIDVVNFQMGQFPLGEHYVIPGLRENLYGRFTVNLGILLPCVYEAEWQKPIGSFVQEPSCTIRNRLSSLAFGKDEWFNLSADTSDLATTIVGLLDKFGLPFFDQFPDYAVILSHYDQHGKFPFQNSARSSLEAAIVAHRLGERVKSHDLFVIAHGSDKVGFRQYVVKIAGRLGYQVA